MGHLLDDPALAGCYLFPRRQPLPDPYVVQADGAELHCWRSPRRPGAPLLVHFHGNGEVVADYVPDLGPLPDGATDGGAELGFLTIDDIAKRSAAAPTPRSAPRPARPAPPQPAAETPPAPAATRRPTWAGPCWAPSPTGWPGAGLRAATGP